MKKPAWISVLLALLLLTACTNHQPAEPSATETVSCISSDVTKLFQQYGWTPTKLLGRADAKLPGSLMTNVEDSPMQFYWIRAVVLSGDAGFDLKKGLGNQVKIEIYDLSGNLPEKYKFPVFQSIRGLVYRGGDGVIIGALVDSGRHAGNSISLSGKDVEDITGMSISEYWYKNYFNVSDSVNIDAKKRTAEDVIRRYFQGVATGDTAMQLSTLCVQVKLQSLFTNLDDSLPYNATPELYQYLSSAKINSIKEFSADASTGLTNYGVEIEAKTSQAGRQVLGDGGTMTRFIPIGEENGMLRVFGDNTGP